MKIYTVVVTYNAEKYVMECFQNLQNSSLKTEVVVVDNASSDNTVELIQDKFPSINIIKSTNNLGFGVANNAGINYALDNGADWILLLNQDAYVNKDTLENLISVASRTNEFLVFSPIHLNGDGSALDYAWLDYYLQEKFCRGFYSDLYLGRLKSSYEIQFVNAAAWLCSPELFRIAGGFNPYFFMYGEDFDLVSRLHQKKLKISIIPSASVRHDRVKKILPAKISYKALKQKFYRDVFLKAEIELLNPSNKFISSYFKFCFFINIKLFGSFFRLRLVSCLVIFLSSLRLALKIPSLYRGWKLAKSEQQWLFLRGS